MPAAFQFPYARPADAWIPADAEARAHYGRDGLWLTIGRLRPSVSISAARAELGLISGRLAAADPQRYMHRPLTIWPLLEATIGEAVRTRLFVLLSAVGFVLLIACVNVASLLLTRSRRRARELAVRAAIGADRRRLIRQLLTEAILLGCVGGAAGVLLAHWMLGVLVGLIPSGIPRIGTIHLDGTVLIVAVCLSLASGLASGLIPACRLSRRGLRELLQDGASVAAPQGSAGAGAVFVFAETSLALVLLIGAGLMIRSFGLPMSVDPGFDTSHLVAGELKLIGAQPPARIRDLAQRARGLQSVDDVTGADEVPFLGVSSMPNFQVQGRPSTAFDRSKTVYKQLVLPGYVRWNSLADDAPPTEYFPMLQGSMWRTHRTTILSLLLRMNPAMQVSLPNLKTEAANGLGEGEAVYSVQSMDAMIARSAQQWKFQAVLLGLFGAFALCIAIVGIFGVTSYAVVQRTREIGVSLALGAQRSDMLRLIVGGTARPVVAGLLVGSVGAVMATRTLSAFLFEIKPTDAPTDIVTAGLFLCVALIASIIPAYRATQVDPVVTLRQE